MKLRKGLLAALVCALCAVLLCACSLLGGGKTPDEEEGDGSSVTFGVSKYQNYAAGFNRISQITVEPETIPTAERDLALEQNEDYEVTYKQVQGASSYTDVCTMGAMNNKFYPGAIFDISGGGYSEVSLPRAPLTISANLESVLGQNGNALHREIESPSLSSVREGIREIVTDKISGTTNLPANLTMEIHEVQDDDEFLLSLGLDLQISKFSLAEDFSYDKIKRQSNVVVVLRQVYYTVDVDYPGRLGFFSEDVSEQQIRDALPQGTIPVYVSSVSYGRIAIISIQSNYSSVEIANKLSAGWGQGAISRLSVGFDNQIRDLVQDRDTTIKYYVYGGDASAATNYTTSLTGDSGEGVFSTLFNTYNAGESVGLPISYQLSHLQGNEIARVEKASDYYVKDVKYRPKKLMDWSNLNNILNSEEYRQQDSLTLDLSAMVPYGAEQTAASHADKTIPIADHIRTFTLIGREDFPFTGLSIHVEYRGRDNPLRIELKKISFSGNTSDGVQPNVYAESELSEVELNVTGRVNLIAPAGESAVRVGNLHLSGDGYLGIVGGDGTSAVPDGSAAVDVHDSIRVSMDGNLLITGGNGTANGTGGVGIRAQNTVRLDSHLQADIKGGSGSRGKDGSRGSNGTQGATGGVGLSSKTLYIGSEVALSLQGGTGGDGGDGGTGVAGVNGNDAAAGTPGGTGGNGGKGGNGGLGVQCTQIDITDGGTLHVRGGNGGCGGKGGDGGVGGEGKTNVNILYGGKDGDKNYGARGGDGGDGGDGGNPGAWGASGCIINGQTIANCVKERGNYGNGGNGGDGGKGGKGGNHFNELGSVGNCGGGSGGDGGDGGDGYIAGKFGKGGSVGEKGDHGPVNGLGLGVNWGSRGDDFENNATPGHDGDNGRILR